MHSETVLYWIVVVIIAILIAWVALGLVLSWFKPALYKNGSVDWWTTFWVSAIVLLFSLIIMIIAGWFLGLFIDGKVQY